MIVTLASLKRAAAYRLPGYLESALAVAVPLGGDRYELTDAQVASLNRYRLGLGDVVERVAKPVARAMKLGCLDEKGALRPESGCAKRKRWLNDLIRAGTSGSPAA